MKRWHEDITHSRREWAKHRRNHVMSNKGRSQGFGMGQVKPGADPYKVDCTCDDQIGRFRKKDAYDCGNVQCYICHGDKYPKRELSNQEKHSLLKMKEQLKESM
jgi:hypothetical protein